MKPLNRPKCKRGRVIKARRSMVAKPMAGRAWAECRDCAHVWSSKHPKIIE